MPYLRFMIFAVVFAIPRFVFAGDCGPGNIFSGNDYCVACGSGKPLEKVYACPGGEVGRVAVGVGHPGCSISYWSPSCVGYPLQTMKANESDITAKETPAPVSTGHAALTKEGDLVVIRMTQKDFDNLMKLGKKK